MGAPPGRSGSRGRERRRHPVLSGGIDIQAGRRSWSRQRNQLAARQARQPQARPDRGRSVPRQAGRPRRGAARLRPQLPAPARLRRRCRRPTTCVCWTATRSASVRPARPASPTSRRWPSRSARWPASPSRRTPTTKGHLYGSVGPAEIAKGLRAKNLPVEADMVRMEGGHIKETGLYEVQAEPRLRDRDRGQGARVIAQDKK